MKVICVCVRVGCWRINYSKAISKNLAILYDLCRNRFAAKDDIQQECKNDSRRA